MRRSSRNAFSFPDFSLRRILLQGARAARGSPPLGRMCDVEKGNVGANAAGSSSGAGSSGVVGGGLGGHASSVSVAATGSSVANHSKSYNDKQSSSNNLHGTPNNKTGNTSSTSVTSSPGLEATPTSEKHLARGTTLNECPLCYNTATPEELYALSICNHAACRKCLERYLYIEITESRTDIACPQCSESMHPSDIQALLRSHPVIMTKYEDFMVRRVLLSDPDSRWCPAPNCSYAVIASGCASCPLIRCERPGCLLSFCYHCKAEWHPDQTCDAARASRHSPTRAGSGSISQDSQHRDDIKPCPRCQVLIVKMNDGSCNHMVCAVCGSEFCWLCMKEISDLHYLSPSGCTFWGKKPWSRKKKLLWQLGTLVGAPVGIALVAGIAVPAMIIGIPVWVGRKIHTRYKLAGKHKRNCAVLSAVTASVLVAPVLAAFAVAIGVPILLFYVYGVVPVSLCRAGCGVSTTRDGFKFDIDEEEYTRTRNQDATSVDAVSRIGATSIGEVSLSVASGPLGALNQAVTATMLHSNRESTTALAGSIGNPTHRLEVQADVSTAETASTHDAASTKALAGSILSHNPHTDSEDGASVRFDKCYVIDGKREPDVWYINHEQDHGADKLSLGSGRSLRSSERSYRDEMDSTSLSSGGHKRMVLGQRMSKLNNRNMSMESTTGSSNCIAENELELGASHESPGLTSIVISSTAGGAVAAVPQIELKDRVMDKPQTSTIQPSPTPSAFSTTSSSVVAASTSSSASPSSSRSTKGGEATDTAGSPTSTAAGNMSKTAILRNIFFSQIASPSSSPST